MSKSILAIVPFDPIYPPTNGGMQRCFHIIHQLAVHFELTVIINQKKEDFLEAIHEYPAIKTATVYSTSDEKKSQDVFSILPSKLQKALRYRWYKKNVKGPADGNFLLYYPVLKRLLKEKEFDVILLENLASLNAVTLIRQYDKKIRIIYNAHNVDSNLAATLLEKAAMSSDRYVSIKNVESTLYKKTDALITCSEKDKADFSEMNDGNLTISVVPNGVNVSEIYDTGVRSKFPSFILFCGVLSSFANQEGLLWFYSSIWPKIKEEFPFLRLMVLGSGDIPLSLHKLCRDNDLLFTGRVNDVKSYYDSCTLSVVPLQTGSGTRLKILEAMSLGVPVVSTKLGAEGLEYTDGSDIIIADEETLFAETVVELLKNEEQRMVIQKNARKLVETKYNWDIIGTHLAEFINIDLSPQDKKEYSKNHEFFYK